MGNEYDAAEAARYSEHHPDARFVLAEDYDATNEENIRLDRKRFENAHAARRTLAKLRTVTADLARVKAESLRVVVDGEACRICDADEGVILVGGNVYQITDHSEWIGMAEGVKYLHQEMPEYDEDTIVQPVRLERWEDEG
jgi:hypothetical protein